MREARSYLVLLLCHDDGVLTATATMTGPALPASGAGNTGASGTYRSASPGSTYISPAYGAGNTAAPGAYSGYSPGQASSKLSDGGGIAV